MNNKEKKEEEKKNLENESKTERKKHTQFVALKPSRSDLIF